LLDDDDEDDQSDYYQPTQASEPPGPARDRDLTPAIDVSAYAALNGAAAAGSPPGARQTRVRSGVREGPAIAGETLRVASGEVDNSSGEEALGGVSRAEDKATRKRASARARVRTNQFKITLEAQLDHGESHHFFRYENDGPGDLPGLFIATPNLLKVGREVRIRVGQAGQFLEATGIVAWRRQRGEVGGTPGMGIELLNLAEPELTLVNQWIADRAPVTI
jgi:hypothetical protein